MLALLAAAALVFDKGPVVSDVTTTEAEIRWEPAIPGATLVVDTGGSVSVETAAIVAPDGTQRARVSGLAPDTLHRYRVRAPGGETTLGGFRTFPASARSPISFVAMGDTRSDHATHARLATRLLEEAPEFVISTGDLVGDGTLETDWAFFFQAEGELLRSTPFFPAMGNHDARGLLNETMLTRWFGRDRYYEVVAGPVIFLFVDSTLAYGGGSAQHAWLRSRLDAAASAKADGRASWIVVLHHHPAFSSAGHGSEPDVQRELVPLYEAAAVDLVLNGHDHVYERLERNGIAYIVTGGGGAPLYDFEKILPESKVRVRAHHYLRVTADTAHLEITAVDLDGNVFDRHKLLAGAERPAAPPAPSGVRLLGASVALLGLAAIASWFVSGRLRR